MSPPVSAGRSRIRGVLWAIVPIPLLVLACSYTTHEREMETRCPDSPLLEMLRREGTLPIIVTLDTGVEPEVELSEEEAAEQRRRIESAQEQLILQLKGTEIEVVRRYHRFPLLALQVDDKWMSRRCVGF